MGTYCEVGDLDDYQEICAFCAEIERRSEHNLFHTLFGPSIGYDYLLAESENFVAMPSIGAVVPGYLLVVPRSHVLSYGYLPESWGDELESFVAGLDRWLREAFGHPATIFEHGSATFRDRGGACTDHAHLHVMPLPPTVDLLGRLREQFEVRASADFLTAARRQIADEPKPYMSLQTPDGSAWVCDARRAPSQFFRRALVAELGRPDEWDWAVFTGEAEVLATIDANRRVPR